MPTSVDVRSIAVKLLKAHHLRYIDMKVVPDPLTGIKVIVLKFRGDKEHSPKAFFDDLNENGVQYKKLVKDPKAQTMICELWPKGQKRQVSDAREKAREEQRAKEKGTASGPSNGNVPYVGMPSPGTQAVMVAENKNTKVAGEQDWEEFRRKTAIVVRRLKIHDRPEIRQIREMLAHEIVKELGADASLIKGARGSDLEKSIIDVLYQNIDLVLDTRGVADSVLRRVASTLAPASRMAQVKRISRGLSELKRLAEFTGERAISKKVAEYQSNVDKAQAAVASGETPSLLLEDDDIISLVASRNVEAAYLRLLELSCDQENDDV